jgi:hypothetical protein
MVCRQFARKIGYSNPEKAYLAGLLHDIGIVAHLWIIPEPFESALQVAQRQHIPLHEAEFQVLGVTHCTTGKIVAEKWHLTPDLIEVVTCHHELGAATSYRDLVAVVRLSDLLCRMSGLGYGYPEERTINFLEEPGVHLLSTECPALQSFDWARFTFELEAYLDEVQRLVTLLYRPSSAAGG